MHCLYCGKPLGFLKGLTDGEFCSSRHRKQHKKLTKLALERLLEAPAAVPETAKPTEAPSAPPPLRGFLTVYPQRSPAPADLRVGVPETVTGPVIPPRFRLDAQCRWFAPKQAPPVSIAPQPGPPGRAWTALAGLELFQTGISKLDWTPAKPNFCLKPGAPARGLVLKLETAQPVAPRTVTFQCPMAWQKTLEAELRPVAAPEEPPTPARVPETRTAVLLPQIQVQPLPVQPMPHTGPLVWASDACVPRAMIQPLGPRGLASAAPVPAELFARAPAPTPVSAERFVPPPLPERATPRLRLVSRTAIPAGGPLSPGLVPITDATRLVAGSAAVPFAAPTPGLPALAAAPGLAPAFASELRRKVAPWPEGPLPPPVMGPAAPQCAPATGWGLRDPVPPRDEVLSLGLRSALPVPVDLWRHRLSLRASWSWQAAWPYARWAAVGATAACLLWVATTRLPARQFVQTRWSALERAIASRAAIEFNDDFRTGLGSWQALGRGTQSWTVAYDGYVRPGRLALFTPSRPMRDYRLEFLAQIERKAVSWVYRAQDTNNYYAAKIVITQPGPLPALSLVRYAVIRGRVERRVEVPVRVVIQGSVPYSVQCLVRGETFTTSIAGEVVDVWSDGRFSRGGVGFFAEPGESARLYWVKVSHQDDLLGRICAYLRRPVPGAPTEERNAP